VAATSAEIGRDAAMSAPIFISHSSRDRDVAEHLCLALERRGKACWISSRDVSPGQNFQEEIVRAIKRARVMILVFSTNANNSNEIKKELALAGQFRLTVIPVRVEDVLPSDAFSYELATRQWIDFFEDWDRALKRLTSTLDGIAAVVPSDEERSDPAPPRPSPAPSPPPVKKQSSMMPLLVGGLVVALGAGGAFLFLGPDRGTGPKPGLPSQGTVADAGGSVAPALAPAVKPQDVVPPPARPGVQTPSAGTVEQASVSPPVPPTGTGPIPPSGTGPVPPADAAPASPAPAARPQQPPQATSAPQAQPAPSVQASNPQTGTGPVPATEAAPARPAPAASLPPPPTAAAVPQAQSAPAGQAAAPTPAPAAEPLVPRTPAVPEAPDTRTAKPAPEPEKADSKVVASLQQPGAPVAPPPDAPREAEVRRAAPAAEAAGDGGQVFRECETCPEMVVVPGGSTLVGSSAQEPARQPMEWTPHELAIPAAFAVGRYHVTFDEWDACVADGGCSNWRPGDFGWGRGRRPVIFVSWRDAKAYVAWLSAKTGASYRLLSEGEWEYAARGCRSARCPATPFWFGETIKPEIANYDARFSYAGSPKAQPRRRTVPVESGQANGFGLVNIVGNVRQWTEDCWSPSPDPPPNGAPRLTGDCNARSVRGGGWSDEPKDLRTAARGWQPVDDRLPQLGFRVARDLARGKP
jgi:formylglycine-generating enzyme required for sulfatase activity